MSSNKSRLHSASKLFKWYTPYLFLLPFITMFTVLMVYPIAKAVYISLSRWVNGSFHYVGLFQYRKLLGDALFWLSIKNTFLILVIQVPVMLLLATLFAALLNSPRLKYKSLWQLGFFLPILIDSVAYSLTFSFILDQNGPLNHFLGFFGIAPIQWLLSTTWSKAAVMIALTWHWTGYNIVILLGAMQSISQEVYEAARLDGANSFRQWVSITLPLLKPILIFEAVLSTIGTLQLFTEPYILTGGGPTNSSLTPVLYLYQKGFQQFDFSYSSAIAYVLAIIIIVLSIIQMKVTREGGAV